MAKEWELRECCAALLNEIQLSEKRTSLSIKSHILWLCATLREQLLPFRGLMLGAEINLRAAALTWLCTGSVEALSVFMVPATRRQLTQYMVSVEPAPTLTASDLLLSSLCTSVNGSISEVIAHLNFTLTLASRFAGLWCSVYCLPEVLLHPLW